MSLAGSRSFFFLAFLASLGLMGAALYLEHGLGLEPCPLCVIQQLCVIAFGLSCLVAALHGPALWGRRLYAGLALLFAGLGGGIACRQIWLQQVPAELLPACLPSFEYMMETLSLRDIVRLLLQGSADCAALNWTLFGMSVPEWSLLAFIVLFGFGLVPLLRRA